MQLEGSIQEQTVLSTQNTGIRLRKVAVNGKLPRNLILEQPTSLLEVHRKNQAALP